MDQSALTRNTELFMKIRSDRSDCPKLLRDHNTSQSKTKIDEWSAIRNFRLQYLQKIAFLTGHKRNRHNNININFILRIENSNFNLKDIVI